jgi:DMSO/TMAO reductase YedYZ molybdopterin-dependent catalytic subunit
LSQSAYRASDPAISRDELQLAARNHGLPLELLREPITPVGLHYLLIHFDIPAVDAASFRLQLGGLVERPLELSLDDLRARPRQTLAVTLECAGNGRALLANHEPSQPWLLEAVGTSKWTGTPLAPLLEEAGLARNAHSVVFTGLDRGFQGGVEHDYERALPVGEALQPQVLLAYEMNGEPLPAQHGYPLRLLVPGWYGMTHVKWLSRITAIDKEFDGWQQAEAYRIDGAEVTRMVPRSLLVPPGIPEFLTRERFVDAGPVTLTGRAWSGFGPVTRVEVSVDGGASWIDAELDEAVDTYAWRGFEAPWDARPGSYELCCRATDAAGNTQPLHADWNAGGYCNNGVHRVPVTAR